MIKLLNTILLMLLCFHLINANPCMWKATKGKKHTFKGKIIAADYWENPACVCKPCFINLLVKTKEKNSRLIFVTVIYPLNKELEKTADNKINSILESREIFKFVSYVNKGGNKEIEQYLATFDEKTKEQLSGSNQLLRWQIFDKNEEINYGEKIDSYFVDVEKISITKK